MRPRPFLLLIAVVALMPAGEVVALDSTVPEHRVDQVWDLGFNGTGITVAIIDTGIDANHLSLNDMDDDPVCTAATMTGVPNPPCQKKIVAFYDALDDSGDDGSGETTPYDDHGHGSHLAGIVAGTGEGSQEAYGALYRGVAPGAQLVGVKVLSDSGSGSFEELMRGMEWTIDNQEKYNIRVATMSLGGAWVAELTQEQEERVTHVANLMVAAGIALTIATGNSAEYGTINAPGTARDVITVGATGDNRELVMYSSKGPTHEGLIKPNIAAIGSSVWSVQNADSVSGEATYVSMSGTSMAASVVAGISALIFEANPDLDPLAVRSILETTSEYRWLMRPIRPNNDYGWGFADADAAINEALRTNLSIQVQVSESIDVIYYNKNETDEWNLSSFRYTVPLTSGISFDIESEIERMQWKGVINDAWKDFGAEDALLYLGESGNHSVLVRAVNGNNETSLPIYLPVYVDPKAPPVAIIDSIESLPAEKGTTVFFNGTGSDSDGTIVAYEWTSDIDGVLSDEEDFSTTGFSVGNHTITFRITDNDGLTSTDSRVITVSKVGDGGAEETVCQNGDTKTADDGCNQCICNDGEWACTEVDCNPDDSGGALPAPSLAAAVAAVAVIALRRRR